MRNRRTLIPGLLRHILYGMPLQCCIGLCLVSIAVAAPRSAVEAPHTVGWFSWDPYQFTDTTSPAERLTGLNVELGNAAFERMGLPVEWQRVEWKAHLERMKQGEAAIAVGASRTPEREAYAWFSEPFFNETVVLVGRKGEVRLLDAERVDDLLRQSVSDGRQLAVVNGYHYGEAVMRFLDSVPDGDVVFTSDDETSLRLLLDGRVDAFLADHLVATTVAWRMNALEAVEVHPLELHASPLYVMFSKAVFDARVVDSFNAALDAMRASGEFRAIKRHYLLPVLLGVTLHTDWFLVVGVLGTFAFALSGVVLARKEGYDIFGAFVLASLPAMGGGVLRDLLTERHPIWILRAPYIFIYVVLAVVIGGVILFKLYDFFSERGHGFARRMHGRRYAWPARVVGVCDALGLAAFTITGVVIAVEQECEPLWLWGALLAALTGAGGGILRDVVRGKIEDSSLKGHFYPEIAVIWGLIFSLFLEWQVSRLDLGEIALGVLLTMLGALATRILVLRYDIRSPLLSAKPVQSFPGGRPRG